MSNEVQKHISGTPWHVGFITKKSDDPRRDKRLCVHFCKNYCKARNGECIGSSHCPIYKRVGEEAIKQALKEDTRINSYKFDKSIVSQSGIVQRGDCVTVYCHQTKQQYTFTISCNQHEELPPIQEKSLGKRRNDPVVCNGFRYTIIKIVK